MKQRLLDKLVRMGYGNLSKRTLSIAFVLWLLPLGTIWSLAFLFLYRMIYEKSTSLKSFGS